MLKSLLRRVGALFSLSLLAGTVPAQARTPEVARPALWAVSDADTTVYLFGTIHLLPENVKRRTPAIEKAVAGSQQLVVETIVDDKNPTKLMTAMASLAFSKGLPPIAERVPPAKRPALDAAIARSGIPRKAFDAMETWAAAFMLLGEQFKTMGLKGQHGVEAVLRDSFTRAGKPVGELESNLEQLGFFDRLPEKAQRDFLEGALEGKDMNKDFDAMLRAWARGDVEAIAKTFDHDLAASPDLQDALIKRRNASWSKWIGRRMGQPGAVLIAVGAGHLAGKYSVIELLKKDGYRVRRVQ